MSADMETRLQAVEELLAHREQELADLSDMVTQQWSRIETLERELTRTKDRIVTLEDDVGDGPAANQKPPHW